jgi:hypothetical protein
MYGKRQQLLVPVAPLDSLFAQEMISLNVILPLHSTTP